MFPPVAEQLAILRRGVEKIVPEEELAQKLELSRKLNRPLRVKYGIDPTGIDVHLGHTVPMRKMRQFQDLGHQAVIIIGNATAMVGDPSGRDEARKKRLTANDVEKNAQDYLEQVSKVVDISKAEVHRNGDWFSKMPFGDVIELCSQWTVQQILRREDFARRVESESPVFLHECLYPVMQAFDSVCIAADIELGGTEQLFTFMLSRHFQNSQVACQLARKRMSPLVRKIKKSIQANRSLSVFDQHVENRLELKMQWLKYHLDTLKRTTLPPQIGVMSPILVGLDGVRRMGKSLGNYIGISESPYEMMKKFMQVPDGVMRMYFELLTNIPLEEVEHLLAGHPKDAKLRLATTVIDQYHPAGSGTEAADRWQREISGGELPADIPTVDVPASTLQNGALPAAVLLKTTGLVPSTSEARRVIGQGGATFGDDHAKMTAHDQAVPVTEGLLIKVGKKKFVRVHLV